MNIIDVGNFYYASQADISSTLHYILDYRPSKKSFKTEITYPLLLTYSVVQKDVSFSASPLHISSSENIGQTKMNRISLWTENVGLAKTLHDYILLIQIYFEYDHIMTLKYRHVSHSDTWSQAIMLRYTSLTHFKPALIFRSESILFNG